LIHFYKRRLDKMEGITIREATPDDFNRVVDFINCHFVPFEPINKAINLAEMGYRMPFFDEWCMLRLKKAGSINIIATDDAGDLVGVAIAIVDFGDNCNLNPEVSPTDRTKSVPDKFQKIIDFLQWFEGQALDKASDFCSNKDQNGILDYIIMSARSDRRIPGLGMTMAKQIMELGLARGISKHTVVTTSAYSARIFEKLGFQQIHSHPFAEYKVDGQVVFPTDNPHTHARFYVR